MRSTAYFLRFYELFSYCTVYEKVDAACEDLKEYLILNTKNENWWKNGPCTCLKYI